MRGLHKNKKNGQNKFIGNDNIQPIQTAQLMPFAAPTQFRLPRQRSPLFVFIMICIATAYAAAQFYLPEPTLPAPVITAATAAPIVDVPPKSEMTQDQLQLEQIAKLIPEAAAAPLPIEPMQAKDLDAKPMITVSQAAPRPSTASLMAEGIELARANQPAAAMDNFEQARALSPKDPTILYNIALLNDKMGDDAEAAKFYRATLRLSPLPNSINAARVQKRLNQLTAEEQEAAE